MLMGKKRKNNMEIAKEVLKEYMETNMIEKEICERRNLFPSQQTLSGQAFCTNV